MRYARRNPPPKEPREPERTFLVRFGPSELKYPERGGPPTPVQDVVGRAVAQVGAHYARGGRVYFTPSQITDFMQEMKKRIAFRLLREADKRPLRRVLYRVSRQVGAHFEEAQIDPYVHGPGEVYLATLRILRAMRTAEVSSQGLPGTRGVGYRFPERNAPAGSFEADAARKVWESGFAQVSSEGLFRLSSRGGAYLAQQEAIQEASEHEYERTRTPALRTIPNPGVDFGDVLVIGMAGVAIAAIVGYIATRPSSG